MLRILRALGNVHTQTLAAVAAISLGLAILMSAYAPWKSVHAQSVGPGGVPGKDASGAVSSVFGRTGAIAGANGDYAASQVTNAADLTASNVFTGTTNTFRDVVASSGDPTPLIVTSANGCCTQFEMSNTSGGHSYNFYTNGSGGEPWGGVYDLNLGGDAYAFAGLTNFNLPETSVYGFTSSSSRADAAPDTGISRIGAGVIGIGNGTAADTSGWLEASAIGNGAIGNTDLRGHVTLSSGGGSYTFAKAYVTAPTCVATDTTTAAPIKVTVTATTMTLTGTGSDVLNYVCAD